MSRALVLVSGGIDSATALAWAHKKHDRVLAISFQYYLRPFQETLAVYRLLQSYPSTLFEVPVPFLREAVDLSSPLPGAVPEGYISNRNLIFYSIACYYAETNDCEAIVGGHNAGDREDFPDAAAGFFARFEALANEALLSRKIMIELPLAGWSKTEVLRNALLWNVPLQHTWSCYWDKPAPCGTCASCTERAEAFANAGLSDPLLAK